MLRNFLSTSGSVIGTQGDDAYALYPYWNTYSYGALTSGELSALTDDNYDTTAATLDPGDYTCIEINPGGTVMIGQFRLYVQEFNEPLELSVALEQSSLQTESHTISLDSPEKVERQNVLPEVCYWDRINASGYMETCLVQLDSAAEAQLVSAQYDLIQSTTQSGLSTGHENQTIKQIIQVSSGIESTSFVRFGITAPPSQATNIDAIHVSSINTTDSGVGFDTNTQDYEVTGDISTWISDQGQYGHFEGTPVQLTPGADIIGNWSDQSVWSGSGERKQHTNMGGYTIRQLIPGHTIESQGDGIRVTLSGLPDRPVQIDNMSYMAAQSTRVVMDFEDNASILREDLKGDIVMWHSDGTGKRTVAGLASEYTGHFEGAEVDFDDGEDAIMYSPNVIGFRCTNHGLSAGDYIRIYGTEHYDGYYIVLTFSTAHIIVVWGIYDPETFTSAAKMRKIISIGPLVDEYDEFQDNRDVMPYVEVKFTSGATGYITNYRDYGVTDGSVSMGPDAFSDGLIEAIYDITVDDGWITNSPGPSTTPDFQTSMPRMQYDGEIRDFTWMYDTRWMYKQQLGLPIGPRYEEEADVWDGDLYCITESLNPDLEGDWTGWPKMAQLFDRKMAQPPWVYKIAAFCQWITLCYRGPSPVKFVIDFGAPQLFSKYRYWLQDKLCPEVFVSRPKSWKIEGSQNGVNEDQYWVTLDEEIDYDPANYISEPVPPDGRLAYTCERGAWQQYRNIQPYRFYRFYIYEPWRYSQLRSWYGNELKRIETNHISEIDFVRHSSLAGISPTVIQTLMWVDELRKVEADEHLLLDSAIYYAFSFDQGNTWKIYEAGAGAWRDIAKLDGSDWKYYDANAWHDADLNTQRKALWHAFYSIENQMDSAALANIPEAAYTEALPNGGYVQFAVGLKSTGAIEAMLKSLILHGTIFSPEGTTAPAEVTFSGGQSGVTIPASQKVTSDWLNQPIPEDNDLLFAMDLHTSVSGVSYWDVSSPVNFYKTNTNSYYLQSVDINYYTLSSGVMLIDSVDTRFAESISIPASGHNFVVSDMVRVSGTQFIDGSYVVNGVPSVDLFNVPALHQPETLTASAYAYKRYTLGDGFSHDVQVGSIVEFTGSGTYGSYEYNEITPRYPYFVKENVCVPDHEAHWLFDTASGTYYHSGRMISKGPSIISINYYDTARQIDHFRLRTSENEQYWGREFPKDIAFQYSTESAPDLENESHWVTLWSGMYGLPLGPSIFGDWQTFTNSGSYNHYRFKLSSNYGEQYDALRFSQIELLDAGQEIPDSYTIWPVPVGADARYLFDGHNYSQWSSYVGVQEQPCVAVDYRNKTPVLERWRMRSVKYPVGSGIWYEVFPQKVEIWGSNLEAPVLTTTTGWEPVDVVDDYTTPGAGGAWADWRTLESTYSFQEGNLIRISWGGHADGGRTFIAPQFTLFPGEKITRVGAYGRTGPNLWFSLARYKSTGGGYIYFDIIPQPGPYLHSTDGADWDWLDLDPVIEVPDDGYDYYIAFHGDGLWDCRTTWDSGAGVYSYEGTFSTTTSGVGFSLWSSTTALLVAVEYERVREYKPYRHYKYLFRSNQGGYDERDQSIQISDLGMEMRSNYGTSIEVTYSGSFPMKLMDLDPWFRVTGVEVNTASGLAGGYVEQAGLEDTGTQAISFWTIVDRHWQLDNGKAINRIGIQSDTAGDIKFKLFKQNTSTNFDISEIDTVTHSGTGFEWFTLGTPHQIPDDGETYYLGWYQANYPVVMGKTTGSGLVSYEYGDFTGIIQSLPNQDSTFLPCLAVRYGSHFTIGDGTDPDSIMTLFSPALAGHQYTASQSYGPYETTQEIYLYKTIPSVEPDTIGSFTVDLQYKDTLEDAYEVPVHDVTQTDFFQISNYEPHTLIDGTAGQHVDSQRRLEEVHRMIFMYRFDQACLVNAYRQQSSLDSSYYSDLYPDSVHISAATQYNDIRDDAYYTELFQDERFSLPSGIGEWAPWVYFDDYDDQYRYYRISLGHYGDQNELGQIGGIDLIVTEASGVTVVVEDQVYAIQAITSSGVDDRGVKLNYNAGDMREVRGIYNAYTSDTETEQSPGRYFYRGENNRNTYSEHPDQVILAPSGIVPVTYSDFSGLQLMAWHKLDEETGDFQDSSGYDVTAYRWGTLGQVDFKRGRKAAVLDNAEPGYAICNLPDSLDEYTIMFWFKPSANIFPLYPYGYDIMGGWVHYGAVPGIWHISLWYSYLMINTPYPPFQRNESDLRGPSKIQFGSYGSVVETSRDYWCLNTWYHMAFGFKQGRPYRIWINGATDSNSRVYNSNVYPQPDVMGLDPADIHYDDYQYANCMYFALPLTANIVQGDFALADVMHFNRLLTDTEIFDLYRLRGNVSEEWDGIYFARDQQLEAPDRLIFDFGASQPCITKYQLLTGRYDIGDFPQASWRMAASGEKGWVDLDVQEQQDLAGEEFSRTIIVQATDTFPFKLVDLNEGIQITSVRVDVVERMAGGNFGEYNTVSGMSTWECCEFPLTQSDTAFNFTGNEYDIPIGKYITRFGIITDSEITLVKPKIFRKTAEFSGYNIDLHDTQITFSGTGELWVDLEDEFYMEPEYNDYTPAAYAQGQIRTYTGYPSTWFVGRNHLYPGDYTGDWGYSSGSLYSQLALMYRYSTEYSVGIDGDTDRFIRRFPAFPADHHYQLNEIPHTLVSGTSLYLYRFADNPDTSGYMRVTIQGRTSAAAGSVGGSYWNNMTNTSGYRHYALEFTETDEPIDLAGIRMVAVDQIPCVSGTYHTVTSGMSPEGHSVLHVIPEQDEQYPGQIKYAASRDNGSSWWTMTSGGWGSVSDFLAPAAGLMTSGTIAGIDHCEWELLGSGVLAVAQVFTTLPGLVYPVVYHHDVRTTDWTEGSVTEVTVESGTGVSLSAGQTKWTDFANHSMSDNPFHYLAFDMGSSNGNTVFTDQGPGYLIDGSYTCSGTHILTDIQTRHHDYVRLPVTSTSGMSLGNMITISGIEQYNGYHVVSGFDSTGVQVYTDFYHITMSGGSYYRRVVPLGFEHTGRYVELEFEDTTISGISGRDVTLDNDYLDQAVTGVFGSTVSGALLTASGVSVARTTLSGQWSFSDVGRLSGIVVNAEEPTGSFITHAVSFDDGTSYSMYDGTWAQIIKLDGHWKYLDGTWQDAPENNALSAYYEAVEQGNHYMLTSVLENIQESEWHKSGAIEVVSGTLDFIQYLYGGATLSGYEMRYVTRSGGLTSLIPDDYQHSYKLATPSGHIDIDLIPQTTNEIIYDRKQIQNPIRVYVANPSSSGVNITEVALLDYQVPSGVLTAPVSSRTYQYPIYNMSPTPEVGFTAYSGAVAGLRNEHVLTGPIVLREQEHIRLQLADIPPRNSIYYGDLRIYFDETLGAPQIDDLQIGSLTTTVYSGSNYLSVFFWSNYVVESAEIQLSNRNTHGSGVKRIYEIGIFDRYHEGWNLVDKFNVLETAYIYDSTLSGTVPRPKCGELNTKEYYGTPDMTSSTAPAPYSAYSTDEGTYSAWKAFNQSSVNHLDCWVGSESTTLTDTNWEALGFNFAGYPEIINKYALQERNFSVPMFPECWTLEATNNNSADVSDETGVNGWVVLDTQSGVASPGQSQWTDFFYFDNCQAYQRYRIKITKSHGDNETAIANLKLVPYRESDYFTYMSLSPYMMDRLIDMTVSGAIPLFSNSSFEMVADLNRYTGKVEEARCYVGDPTDTTVIFYTKESGAAWDYHQTVWSGSYFTYAFDYPRNITNFSMWCAYSGTGNTVDDLNWCRAVQLINAGEDVNFGTTESGTEELVLPTRYADYNTIEIFNNSWHRAPANARVLPRFSNNYYKDNVLKVSDDGSTWYQLDNGVNMPEDIPFDLGTFNGTELVGGKIQLQDGVVSGTWTSPVVEVLDPSSTTAYVYCDNAWDESGYVNINDHSIRYTVEVKSSNTRPMQKFMVTAVDTVLIQTGELYPFKTVLFNSDGEASWWYKTGAGYGDWNTVYLNRGLNEPTSYGAPVKYWYYTGPPTLWQFYGALQSDGFGASALGLISSQWVSEDWYNLYRVFPQDNKMYQDNLWGYDVKSMHNYTNTNTTLFPIFNRNMRYTSREQQGEMKRSWHTLDVVYRDDDFYELYQEDYYDENLFHLRSIYSYYGDSDTPEDYNEIDYIESFPGTLTALQGDGIRCAACIDSVAGPQYCWFHFSNTYEENEDYRILLLNGTQIEQQFTDVEKRFNFMVEPSVYAAPRGFWGICDTEVIWYSYDGSALTAEFSVGQDGAGDFVLINKATVDMYNNLWFVDLGRERVVRVNYADQAADYTREVSGATDVWPEPINNSAYVYVIRDPECPDSDCVRLVTAGDYDFLDPELVCTVPNVAIVEQSNVCFYGRSLVPDTTPGLLPEEPYWGEAPGLSWQLYSSGSPTLPKGQYKQFKITLIRQDQDSTSPAVSHIRVPVPGVVNKIPYGESKTLFIDTLTTAENNQLNAGEYTVDLLVWWPRE